MKRILYTVCGAEETSVERVLEEAEGLGIQLPGQYQQPGSHGSSPAIIPEGETRGL